MSDRTRGPLPDRSRSLPGCARSFLISSTTLPSMTVVFVHVGSLSVVETTYFLMLFIRSPNSPVSCIVGHAAAKPSYVMRPSSSASVAASSCALNCEDSSLQKENDHFP